MAISIKPYVLFVDNAQAAVDFYKQALGADVEINSFCEFGTPDTHPSHNLIMHAAVRFAGTEFFVSDSLPMGGVKQGGENVELSINGTKEDDEQLGKYFAALAEGGTIRVPLDTAPWGARFGMLTDKFGLNWMVNVDQSA
jgi:PhnB protein